MKKRKIAIETTKEWQDIYKVDGQAFLATSYEDLVRHLSNMF